MSSPAFTLVLSTAPITAEPWTFDAEEGAETQFLGTVRGSEDGDTIRGIDYSAYHEMAERQLHDLVQRGIVQHGAHRVHVQHRLGFVAVGEPSILIRVRTKHSAQAFDLCRWYLAEIKTHVPIWKQIVR